MLLLKAVFISPVSAFAASVTTIHIETFKAFKNTHLSALQFIIPHNSCALTITLFSVESEDTDDIGIVVVCIMVESYT